MKSPDKAGEKELHDGNIDGASDAWFRSFTLESKHNLMVLDLIMGNYADATFESYELLIKQEYRQEVINCRLAYTDLLCKFKDYLFDESNVSSVPGGVNLSWEQYLKGKVLSGLSNTLYSRFLISAKSQIDPNHPSSYLSALSSMMKSETYLNALSVFADTNDRRYKSLTKDIVDSVQIWVEEYLEKSCDILKFRAVQSYLTTFSSYSPDEIQSSYIKLVAWNIQQCGALRILPDICEKANTAAKKIYTFYTCGELSSAEYCSIIEDTAPLFVLVKQASVKEDSCYIGLVNFLATVGFSIISNELSQTLTDQIVADAGTVIRYIDDAIDGKLLNVKNKQDRNRYMNQLWNLGLGPVDNPRFPNARRKMHYDSAIYKDEDTIFHSYCNSYKGCQYYLRRFPKGKYILEVNELIAKYKLSDYSSKQQATYQSTSNYSSPSEKKSSINVDTKKKTTVSKKKRNNEITSQSVLIFIAVSVALEIGCCLLFDNAIGLIVGLFLSLSYWLYCLGSIKTKKRQSTLLVYLFVVIQSTLSIIGLVIISKNLPAKSNLSECIVSSIFLGVSLIVNGISRMLDNYLMDHPGPSRHPNGKHPPFLGTGNGIGLLMTGDFNRQPSNGRSVTANYVFVSIFLPLFPIGCYNANVTGFSRKSHKESSTSYSIAGSLPWRLIEIIQIYLQWYSMVGIGIGIIGLIAVCFGESVL